MGTSSREKISVAVLMACHNRAQKTNAFFNAFRSASKSSFEFDFVVTDDGSTDDTLDVLKSQPERIKVVSGNGELFWARAMNLAEDSIEKVYDAILWVNDDIVLTENAFERLLDATLAFPNSVIVGQVAKESDDRIIYGGYKRSGIHPLKLELLNASEKYLVADTFNGNFVYIPAEIHRQVGTIDGRFAHGYADCDYGFRVCKAGYSISVIPGIVAYGLENQESWPASRRGKIRQLASSKYSPIASQLHFFRKHIGVFWPILTPLFAFYPYLRILLFNKIKDKQRKPLG
jgi:GT2 family glycosyltransferase